MGWWVWGGGGGGGVGGGVVGGGGGGGCKSMWQISLPWVPLGRVSTEQSMESSGDEFAALRQTAPTRMIKSRNVSNKNMYT